MLVVGWPGNEAMLVVGWPVNEAKQCCHGGWMAWE